MVTGMVATTTLNIDPEFQKLIRQLDADEYAALEASILADGCRDAIVVWDGTIVDGHHRYEICTRHGIPFNTVNIHFDSRDEAIVWIIDNQLARRNLSKYERSTLVLRKKELEERRARQRMADARRNHEDNNYAKGNQNSDYLSHSSNGDSDRSGKQALDILAEEAGVSRDTLHKVHVIETSGLECVRELVRRNELSIHRAYQLVRELEKLPEEDRELAAALCGEYVEKAAILVRLYKSSQRDGSNDTYGEIMSTGGFHHGTDMEEWCDFAKSDVDQINAALKRLSRLHAMIRAESNHERQPSGEYSSRFTLYTADIRILDVEPDSIDVIITDPPYSQDCLPLYEHLAKFAARVLKPGGSLFAMCGQSYLPSVMAALCEHLSYNWTIAYLTPGGQASQIWPRRVNTFWKPVLWMTKGQYTGHWVGDVCRSAPNDNDKRFHDWGQSVSGMVDLVKRCALPGQTILDPFCGGGTTGVAALLHGCRFVGSDIDADAVKMTRCRLEEICNADIQQQRG